MRIAWFTHRYHPCVGGAENYGRAMVRRFAAAGHDVEVLTSDALDLWYFNDAASPVERPESRASTGPGSIGSRSSTCPSSAMPGGC